MNGQEAIKNIHEPQAEMGRESMTGSWGSSR